MTTHKSVKRKKSSLNMRPTKKSKMGSAKIRHNFSSFPSEAAELNLNAITSGISDVWADPDSPTTSVFNARMMHWTDLNLTQGFMSFASNVRLFSSLPLVIHNKEKIFESLKSSIAAKDELCLESLFDLFCAFAVDLQHEFAPFYDEFLVLVADCAKLRNASVIKACFDALNQIIRTLIRSASSTPQLLTQTLKLFSLGVPTIAHRLCAGAVAQILRKSGHDLLPCIRALLDHAVTETGSRGCGGSLVHLAGMILIQSLKMTSKAVVVSSQKTLTSILNEIDTLSWETESVVELFLAMLDNLQGLDANDISTVLTTFLSHWSSSKPEIKFGNAKLQCLPTILKFIRGKKLATLATSKNCETMAVTFISHCLPSSECDEDVLTEAVVASASGSTTEESWSLMRNILTSPETSKERKAQLVNSISRLDHFESFLLHRLVQQLLALPNRDEALYLAIEGLNSFAVSKLEGSEASSYAMEFPCANPSDLNTLPNRLLLQLEKPELGLDEKKILALLSVARPLHQDVAIKLFTATMKRLSLQDDQLESLGLAVRCFGELSCPKDFVDTVKKLSILPKLQTRLSHPAASSTLAYIITTAGRCGFCDWLEPEAKMDLARSLIRQVHRVEAKVRHSIASCLMHLCEQVENFEAIVRAESIEPTIQSYREKVKFLSKLSCPPETVDDFVAEANIRFLVANLSVNFSLMWDPVQKILDSYFGVFDTEKIWGIFYEIFHEVNQIAAEPKEERHVIGNIDFPNYRNLMLKSLEGMGQFAERKNAILANEFLDVFMAGKQETKDPKGLAAFLNVYKQLNNLRSASRFEEIRALAERCLGDHFTKTRELGVEFYAAAYKELRPHKSLLTDLVDAKKWRPIFLDFPVDILNQSERFCELLGLIMVGKIRQTTKEKRKEQLAARKVIVRSIFQVDKRQGLEFLRLLREQQAPFLNNEEVALSPHEMSRKLDMIFDVYLLAANSAVTSADGVIGGAKEIFTELIRILKFKGRLILEKTTLKKPRPKLLEQLIQTFKALQANEWTSEEEQTLLNECIWPLLQPEPMMANTTLDANVAPVEPATSQRIHHLAKIISLFNLFISIEKYNCWFFMKNSKGVTILNWVQSVFDATSVGDDFRQKLLTSMCRFILVNDADESKKERLSDEFLRSVLLQFQLWFRRKAKVGGSGANDLPVRLSALTFVVTHCRNFSDVDEKLFFDRVIAYAARQSQGPVQGVAITLLSSLIIRRRNEPPPASAFKLLSMVVSNEENKLAVRKLLWKHIDNLGIPLNDKLLNAGAYKTILDSPGGISNHQFLFLLHFCASEIYANDFSTRSTAGCAIRELVHVMKKQKSTEDFLHLVDSALLAVISRGLQSKHERVQAEFIEILLEASMDDGRLGNNVNIAALRNDTDDPEMNFFDNMKHIQKHRRGRALRRLATRLDEDESDFVNVKCCHQIIYPLACSILFNPEYSQQSDTIQAAISCVGSLCARFGWKEYKLVLNYFLGAKPTELPHQKQRVKVLGAILNSFHFAPLDGEIKSNSATLSATKIVDSLLHRLRIQREDDEIDCALYVPILKILLLYPKKLKSNISTLLVQTARKLRSRLIEDRKLARDILCEMATLLGPNYFPYIISVLEGALQRGYQLHILVHTINTVMNAMESKAFQGCYDSSVPKIFEFVGKELFGNLTEEKKIAAIIKKTPEASKTVGYSLIETLASRMSKSMIADILSKLLATSWSAKSSFEAMEKLRKAIRSLHTGLSRNADLERPNDYLQLSFGLLSGKLLSPENLKMHSAVIKEFSLSLLLSGITGAMVTGSQVRPFWPFLREALENKDVNVVIACLKFLSAVTQSKEVCDVLIDCDQRDFVGVISSKCKQYHGMKNKTPYMCVAVVLRNLLTHGETFEADHLKAICMFFQGCLDSNRDDANAMKLLGLVLFRFYSAAAYAPFLKLLCTSCVQCRSESTFNVARSILLKIAKKHSSSFHPAINFFIANLNYEEETGRRRTIAMCNLLLEACPKQQFEIQGLFVEAATRLFNEYSGDCKKLLEKLLTTIIRWQQRKTDEKNMIQELIVKWCCSPKPMHVGIGAKLMSLNLATVSNTDDDPNAKFLRRSIVEVLPKVGDILSGIGDDGSVLYAFALAHNVELLNNILTSMSSAVAKELFAVKNINSEKIAGLVLHQNTVVRRSVVTLFSCLVKIGLDETSQRHDTSFEETSLGRWISGDVFRTLVSNLCELAKSDPFEELAMLLASIFILAEKGQISELTVKFMHKKARSIFTHEKFNSPSEFTRRKLFYMWAKEVVENSESPEMKEMIKKYLVKDMKQEPLADITNDVQKIIEISLRKK